MRPPRRYSDWRPVARRRVPARWIGTAVGSLAFATVAARFNPSSITVMGATALGVFVANRIAARRLRDLRDEGEDRQFAAVLRLSHSGVDYGHDEGLVSFEDGYLVFMGRRCAFSLGARDVRVSKLDANELGFRFKGPGGQRTAHLQFARRGDRIDTFQAWRKDRRCSRASVLPPALPDPSLPRTPILIVNALPTLALLSACLVVRGHSALDRWLLPAMGAVLAIVIVVWTFHQALELGRLASGERSLVTRLRRSRRRRVPVPGAHPVLPAVRPVETPPEARIDA